MGSLFQETPGGKIFSLARAFALMTWMPIILALSLSPLLSHSQIFADTADAEPPLYGMLVTGKRPGPPLWKVTNQDSVLWIFGTLRTLPKRLRWDPASVRFILSESEVYISPPNVISRELNPFRAISLLRKFLKAEKIPDGKTLEDVLPEELYARFLEVKLIYAPRNNKILNLRPAEAGKRLFNAALDSIGLSSGQRVGDKLRSIARGRGVTRISHDDTSLDPNIFLQGYENIQMEEEIACLDSTLETIETDLEAMIVRTNAWADGDADLLLRLDYPDRREICGSSIYDGDELKRVFEQTRIRWIASIENALSNNKTSFANFPMREIVHPEGLLAQLKQQGYAVTGQMNRENKDSPR